MAYDNHEFGENNEPNAPGPGGSSEAAPPVLTLDQIIEKLHTSWTNGDAGHTRTWSGQTVTYSMPDTAPSNDPDLPVHQEANGQVTMTTAMQNSARLAFELWDDLIAINLTESNNDPAADITFAYSSTSGGTHASPILDYGANGQDTIIGQQMWFDSTWETQDDDADLFFGGYGFQTYMHEIGHALGLSHPGQYNGSATYANDAEFAQDNRQYTIMSYFGAYRESQQAWTQDEEYSTDFYSSTPMLYDIAAIQAKYGADYTTRAGNTTYGFNSNAGREVYDFNLNDHPIFAIWDGGGTDTIDTHFYYDTQYINLGEGAYSSILGLTGNVAIAYGAVIEHAKGGSGQDYIQGNAVGNNLYGNGDIDQLYGMSGNDRLDGGQGADRMFGGAGDDNYYVDNINDFIEETSIINGHDKVYSTASSYTLPYKVEVLTLQGGAVSGTGNGAANEINGNLGDNILDGGAGADILRGGQGADTYYVDNFSDQVLESSTPEIDTVHSTVSYILGNYVENLALEGGAVYGTGNTLDNVITGNEFYNELFGDAGADTLEGAGGLDLLTGGIGKDAASYEHAATGVIASLANASINSGDADGDAYISIESLVGSSFDDALNGSDEANAINGGLGSDIIKGYGDDDVLAGGEGNDTLIGGSGADYLSGGTGTDTASYFGATAGVAVSLANPAINSGDAAGDTYNSIENLSGSGFDDTLTGNSGANVITGGAGNDILTGGAGGDIFVFSAALDAVANVDTIVDFSATAETIDLDSAFFSALSAIGTLAASAFKDIANSVKDASDRIIYNSDTGNLYYDADGSGDAFGNVKFASFANLTDLTAADFVVI
ncbi:M10 family metallopeptidase C-terminal domain-containing protein [Mesorhizobium sp. IMUNJ 23232]|uniref:M10 family metallopeptidase C-terminal domain-containing protein n=1 Tax=Mesorhizobium sp. IMUNJ 23232 TaxID=3376064 RepID=UPI00378EF614